MLARIKLKPDQRGFMPFKSNTQLSEQEIKTFETWKAQGFLMDPK
jgi:hypothetical protein